MGAHSSKEKFSRSASERYGHTQVIERERFGSFGKKIKGKILFSIYILNIKNDFYNGKLLKLCQHK